MRKVKIEIEIEIPDHVLMESIAVCRDGSIIGFSPYAEPYTTETGRWENHNQYKSYLWVSNWRETLTEVDQ